MKYLTLLCGILNIILLAIAIGSKTGGISPSISQEKFQEKYAQTIGLWQVDRVSDGDSITASQGNDRRRIRLCGIDAPESNQAGGEEAAEALKKIVKKENAIAIAFIEQDRYGRWIGEIFANPGSDREIFVNEELVKMGLVWPYKQYWENCPNQSAIAAAIDSAENPIWDQPGNVPPWEWRQKSRP